MVYRATLWVLAATAMSAVHDSRRAVAQGTVTSPISGPTSTRPVPLLRTWNSANGLYSIEAELLDAARGSVTLRRTNGVSITVPLASLCDADRDRILLQFPNAALVTTAMPDPPGEIRIQIIQSTGERPAEAPSLLLQKLERAAQSSRTAAQAFNLYESYLAARPLPLELQSQIETNRLRWNALATQEAIRLGTRFLDPAAASAADTSARELVRSAMPKLRSTNVMDVEQAKAELKAAADADTSSTTSNILTSLVYAATARNYEFVRDQNESTRKNYELAHSQLSVALQRNPSDIAALNNIGIVELRQGKYLAAINRWQRGLQISPTSGVILHNIKYFLSENEKQNIRVQPQDILPFRTFVKIIDDARLADPHAKNGWLYLPPLESVQRAGDHADASATVVVGRGTGFAIAAGYVLANLENATPNMEVWLGEPSDPLHRRTCGSVVAIDAATKMCIIRADELRAPAIPLCLDLPPLDTNIRFLGYIEPDALGQKLMACCGSIIHSPAANADRLCVCNTPVRLGLGAIPTVDASGRLIAVATASHDIGGWRAFCVPTTRLTGFLSQHVPSFAARTAPAAVVDWNAVDECVARSIVMVSTTHRLARDLCSDIPAENGNPLEDRLCNFCSGAAFVDCSITGCKLGQIQIMVREVTGRHPQTGDEIFLNRPTRVPCVDCGGDGKNPCPRCSR